MVDRTTCKALPASERSAADFYAECEAQGLTPHAPYSNSRTRVPVTCRKGHVSTVRPDVLRRKGAMGCRECMKQARAAKQVARHGIADRFEARLKECGWVRVGEVTLAKNAVEVICPRGHTHHVKPGAFLRSKSECHKSEWTFTALAAERGFKLRGGYGGIGVPIPAICPNGHECELTPSSFLAGTSSGCLSCWRERLRSRDSPTDAARASVQLLIELGWEPMGEVLRVTDQIEARCPAGHVRQFTLQDFLAGSRKCATCTGHDGRLTLNRFLALVTELGARLTSPCTEASKHVTGICAKGHEFRVTPDKAVARGNVCSACGRYMRSLYLVLHPELPFAKIGVAGGKKRLTQHIERGWTPLWETSGHTNLAVRDAERAVLKAVRAAHPARLTRDDVPGGDGHTEVFHIDVLPLAMATLEARGFPVVLTTDAGSYFEYVQTL